MPANGTTERPARYFTDREIALVLRHVRHGLSEARSGLDLRSPVDERTVTLVRAGAGPAELTELCRVPRLDAELMHLVVAAMASAER